MSEATIEIDGEVYALASSTMNDNTQTYTTVRGERYVMRIGAARAHVMTKDFAAQALVKGAPHPCRLTLGGTAYTGHVWVEGWSHSDQQVDLIVENLEAIPATPALDETTDPADLDWGAVRSACDRRDWREAWGVVGTDHVGDATPGEVYLLSVARHKSATAAALWQWRELRERVIPLSKGNVSWQRIKGIAAWESSARAQYDERGNRRARLQAAVREQLVDAARDAATQARLYGRGISTPHMVGGPFGGSAMRAIIDDPVTDWAQRVRLYGRDNAGDELLDALRQMERATQAADTTVRPTDMWIDEATLDALRQCGEDNALIRGNGGVVGVLSNPYLSAAAQRGEITSNLTFTPGAMRALRDLTARVDAAARALGTAAATTLETVRQIDATTRALNPAPRGPQTGRRRR